MQPSAEIYYFSGTGNSLFVARSLAELIHAQLIPIASLRGGKTYTPCAELIGIVFPSYLAQLYGIPLMVENFVRNLREIRGKYIFAICTYGGFGPVNAYPTLHNLAKLVHGAGGKLSGQFSIKLPLNNLDYDHVPIPINRNHDIMFAYTAAKLRAIHQRVSALQPDRFRLGKKLAYWLLRPWLPLMGRYIVASLRKTAHEPPDSRLGFRELIYLTDKSITVTDNCTGCGLCAKICPAQNIVLANNRPVWQHRCEMCLACDEWCPQKAIQHWCKTVGKDYHHPMVKPADMVAQSQS